MNIKNIILLLSIFILGIGITSAAVNNFFKNGNNWDANVPNSSPANDVFILNLRLDIEDSRATSYKNGYRGKITGTIVSDLFGLFNIVDKLTLRENGAFGIHTKCGTTSQQVEVYSIAGIIRSFFWGDMIIDTSNSYFCSNKYLYLKLTSPSLGEKEGGNTAQGDLIDNFDKQEIYISGIAKLKGNREILARGDDEINNLGVYSSKKTITNKFINKNIHTLFKTFKDSISYTADTLNNFGGTREENYYLHDLSTLSKDIDFKGSGDYINKGEIVSIGSNGGGKVEIDGKHTLVVKSGNIYINSNIYNKDDNSLLVIVSKRDSSSKRGGNIYIDPNVTNIDAVLIADGSLISLSGNSILDIKNIYQVNLLRKQLLIYGSLLSSNVVGSEDIPYGADYYEGSYPVNTGNIFDLGNLRSFNLNYGDGTIVEGEYLDGDKLYPIDGNGGYIKHALAGKCEWYSSVDCDINLRKIDKLNPLIILYNNRLQLINPMILRSN